MKTTLITKLLSLITIISISSNVFAEDPSKTKQVARFEITLSENFLTGSCPLMNYAGINLGYCFKSNDKIMLDLSFGKGLTGQPFQTQVLSLMYGHEFRNSDLFGTQIGIGPGVMRVLNEDSVYSYRPSATMVLQHRFYITQKSFVGFSAKALLSKETYGTSFVGVIWGTKL